MGFFSKRIGQGLGALAGRIGQRFMPIRQPDGKIIDGAEVGRKIGGAIMDFLPFKSGGRVRKTKKRKSKSKRKK